VISNTALHSRIQSAIPNLSHPLRNRTTSLVKNKPDKLSLGIILADRAPSLEMRRLIRRGGDAAIRGTNDAICAPASQRTAMAETLPKKMYYSDTKIILVIFGI